ncbi:MAG: YraN family protein [Candidatus Omnitrophota bacterium]|nr:YraN family protein [Candidatus Omnitrophota bacterium]
MTFARINSGKKGEAIAADYLNKQGYKIIERNYRIALGEIDIIAEDKGCICFIEVRSVNSRTSGLAEETISKIKQRQISKAALAYIKKYRLEDRSCRFDALCIRSVDSLKPEINFIKNAFELNHRYSY